MIRKFLQFTDDFLCNRVKNVFEETERAYLTNKENINVKEELEKLQENPLGCMIGNDSSFETTVKIKIKLILAFFFVVVPLLGFNLFTYLVNMPSTYAFILTLVVAILVASRIEEIVNRYVKARSLRFVA